jgi:hypothetical protein
MTLLKIIMAFMGLCAMGCRDGVTPSPPQPPSTSPTMGLESTREAAKSPEPAAASSATKAFDPAPEALGSGALAPPIPRGEGFRRGVALGLFVSTDDEAAQQTIYGMLLDEIAATGATDVQVVLRWAQPDPFSAQIAPEPGLSVSDSQVRWVVAAARSRGLRVMLLPILHLSARPNGAWRGSIAPTDRAAWWLAYRKFVLHHAQLATDVGAVDFAVGSELVSMERDEDQWRALIGSTRKVFAGTLTYSANWDHFEPLRFADALDVLGVTAYCPLVSRRMGAAALDPSQARLEAGWRGFRARVRAWSNRVGRPVVITEVGWPAQDHAALRPWDYTGEGPARPELQARLYRAFYAVWQADAHLAGVYFWNWFGEGGPEDRGYSPRGRAAEQVLRHWFSGPRD